MSTILFLAALVLASMLLAALLSFGNFMITKAPIRPEWQLTEDEVRAKELRLCVGRDAGRGLR